MSPQMTKRYSPCPTCCAGQIETDAKCPDCGSDDCAPGVRNAGVGWSKEWPAFQQVAWVWHPQHAREPFLCVGEGPANVRHIYGPLSSFISGPQNRFDNDGLWRFAPIHRPTPPKD